MYLRQLFTSMLCFGIWSTVFAEEVKTDLPGYNAMQQHYKDQRSQSHNLFYSAPTYHLIPQRNMITMTASIDYTDLTVVPKGNLAKELEDQEGKKYLKKKGWEASPLIGFASKKFGVGLSAEFGNYETEYYYQESYSNYYQTQKSNVQFSGIGLFAYYIPETKWLPNYVTTTLILGYRKLNALHKYSGIKQSTEVVDEDFENFRYQVRKIDYGFNFGVKLAKKFTIFPWLNYTNRLIGAAKNGDLTDLDPAYEEISADQHFIFDASPRYKWGIDFALQVSRLDIHLGGLFGTIGGLTLGSDRLLDNSMSIAVTYSFKSR